MPFKSEAQRRYLWANEPEIARDWTDTYGSRIKKSNGGITQAGAINYEPSEMVSVPKEFRARSHSPNTHLAYITDDEAGILQALKPDTPHLGPRGIPNYDSFDAQGGYTSGTGDKFSADPVGSGKDHSFSDPQLPPAVAAAVAAGKPTSVTTKEDEKRARKEARKFRETKYGQGYQPINFIENVNYFNRQKNLDLARKRAFQKYKDLEKYVHGDFDMDYDFTVDIYGNKVPKGLEYLVSNKGTPIETQRKNLYDVNPTTKYSLTEMLLGKIRPDTQVTLENTLNKARDYNQLVLDSSNLTNQEITDRLTELKNRGKTPDQINLPRDGEGGQQAYIPLPYQQILPEEETEREQKEFAYRFGDTQNVGADVTRASYIFNQGGRVPAAGGGIMNAVPRQGFFLGKIAKGIGKAVGSVAKAAGKVLKSDFGKAALIGLGGYYLGGGQMFGLRPSAPGFSFSNLGKNLFLKSGKNWGDKGALSLGKILGLSAALPFIPGINDAKQDILPGSERGGRLLDSQGNEALPADLRAEVREAYESGDADKIAAINDYYNFLPGLNAVRLPDITPYLPYPNYATGGRVAAQEGGLMNLGGMEKDYRNTGGFVDIGAQEKADDVPARLSVNEFVMTADAVRNAGGGDIDKGAEVMENMMKNLENGGRVSEESQGKGNTGAQEMFSVSERIGEVI